MGHRPHRQYHRWEGVYAADFTLEGFRRRIATVVDRIAPHGWSCLVAFDARFMANQFAVEAFQLLSAAGIPAFYCPHACPLPALERTLDARRADCALIVSAGSRPAWYLGVTVMTPRLEEPLFSATLAEPQVALSFPSNTEPPEQQQIQVRALYLETMRTSVDIELIRRTSQTVFVDSMGGASGGYVSALLGEGSLTRAVEINRDPDPLFARQTPHPWEAGLTRLRKLVRESDSHLGAAISADGCALGVVDNAGDLISPLETALAIGQHLSRQYRQRGTLVVPTHVDMFRGNSQVWEDTYGLRIEQIDHAGRRIQELIEHDRSQLVVGINEIGEITLGRLSATPDALLAAMVLIETVARSGMKLRHLLNILQGKA